MYGFTLPALKLVHEYFSDRKQRTRVNNLCSTCSEKRFGVPEGSIRGLFFISSKIDIENYGDDNTAYTNCNDVNGLIKSLEEASKELFKWFDDNLMKIDPDKFHLLVNTNLHNVAINIEDFQIQNTKRGELLGMQLTTGCFLIIIY